jgi:hypothetical protein
VDYAPSGPNKEKGAVYLTAYHDRKELAAKVVDILPAFIDHYYGRELAKKWCHPSSMSIIHDITFLEDEDGNDLGEWTTVEDDMGQEILDEDMGIQLDLSNLGLLEFHPEDRVLLNADDASAASFRSALGAERNVNDDHTDPVIHGACQATIVTQESMTMSGADSV